MSTPWVLSNVSNAASVSSSPRTPIVLLLFSVTLGFIVVITIIYFVVGVHGKGFPVDSSLCIYLIFLFHPISRGLISYIAWLVCGRLVPKGLGLMVFSLAPGWIKRRGWGSFFSIASAGCSLCSQYMNNTKHMIKKKRRKLSQTVTKQGRLSHD